MGIFSEETTVVVSSVVYNMGGSEEDRPTFLKSIVLGNMLSRGNTTMGETIVKNYLSGPAIKLRSFYRWAETNFTAVGIPTDAFTSTRGLDAGVVFEEVGDAVGETIRLEWVEMALANPTYWAIQWMAENMPEEEGEWTANYNDGDTVGTITFADGITPSEEFPLTGYVYGDSYIYAAYVQDLGSTTGPLVTGDVEILAPGASFPSVTGWTLTSSSTIPTTVELETTTVTTKVYSDSRPNEVTTVTTTDDFTYDSYVGNYTKTTYNGLIGTERTSTVQFMTLIQDAIIDEEVSTTSSSEVILGVTVTTTVVVTEETRPLQKSVQIDTQTIYHSVWSNPLLFIYRKGSGNAALDALFVESVTGDGYFPMIPLRLKNDFLSDSYEPELYEQSKIAYKKAFNSDYDDMITELTDNPDLEDIDYAYVVFGANLNTKNVAVRQYIYEYFHRLMSEQPGSPSTDMEDWVSDNYVDYTDVSETYRNWFQIQMEIGEDTLEGEFTPEPQFPTFQAPPITELRIKTDSSVMNFDIQIDWDSIVELSGTGEGKPGAVAGDIWFTGVANDPYATNPPPRGITPAISKVTLYKNQVLSMWWQVTDTSWKRLDITGLVHRNFIWKNKAVSTWGIEALLDEDESAFIIPLHAEVYRNLPMKVATEMSASAAHMLFNVYVIDKQHWYEQGIFKIILFIIAVVITVINPTAGLVIFAQVIGVSVLVAAIILVAINMIAAMILMNIISGVSVAIFGEKVGQIIASIAYFVITMMTLDFSNTGSAILSWSNFLDPVNLIGLTNAVGNGIAGFMNATAAEYIVEAQNMLEQYENQMEDLAQKYKDVFGDGISYIDPMGLTETSYGWYETRETFLSRTLLTGTDIAELSHRLLSDFPEITLRLDKPI